MKRKRKMASSERGIGIILESLDDKISTVAEQYGNIQGGSKDIKKTQISHTEMIGDFVIDVAIVKQDVEFIKNSLKRKVDIEEFTALERRVALLATAPCIVM